MRRLAAVSCAVFLGSLPAFALVTSTASATGNQSCVNLVDKCVGEQNSTSPTNYRGFGGYTAVNSYAPYAYQNGTAIEDRINSVRVRTESTTYTGVCWYRDANQSMPRTYRSESAGWYDNSSVDLSSSQWVTSACV